MLGATWGPDDTIVFATTEPGTGLQRVPAGGGTPTVLTTPDKARGEIHHAWPEFLPGGRAVLYHSVRTRGEDFQIAAFDISLATQKILCRAARARDIRPAATSSTAQRIPSVLSPSTRFASKCSAIRFRSPRAS
jgi:hypothetical protein